MTKNLRRIAVHEAGHFVFCCTMQLGTVRRLSIEPSSGTRHRGVDLPWSTDGRIEWKPCHTARAFFAERDGKPLETMFTPRGVSDYIAGKDFIAHQLLLYFISGAAAEVALAGGDGTVSGTDWLNARDAALAIVPEKDVVDFIGHRLCECATLCAGPLKRPIFAVADRLLNKPTLDEHECTALWAEVDPSAAISSVSESSPWHPANRS
jgi:hypothetical protein